MQASSVHTAFRSCLTIRPSRFHRSDLFQSRCSQSVILYFLHHCLHRCCSLVILSLQLPVLYGDLDMWDVRNPDTLWIFLPTRWDFITLTHSLGVPAWTPASTQSRCTRMHRQPLFFNIPFLLSTHRAPSLRLWSTPWSLATRRPRLSSSYGSIARPMSSLSDFHSCLITTTRPCPRHFRPFPPSLRAQHAKPTASISHASVITAPAYTKADSGHVHAYSCYCAPQPYYCQCPSASYYPPRAVSTSNRRVHKYFYANLH